MNRNRRGCRHRVALRPKVRRQRLKLLVAVAALAVLAGAAALTVRHLSLSLSSAPGFLSRFYPRIESVEISGAPASLAGPMTLFLREPGARFWARAAELPARFPALKTVTVRRDWLEHRARVNVTLRRALGCALRGGRPEGFLDEEGLLFQAPEALYPEARLLLDVEGADAARLQALAAALAVLARDADLPAPVERVSYRSAYDGWEVSLGDGTKVIWGDLNWTREKLARLSSALHDARQSFAGTLVADLRYFDDGRVLLRPRAGGRL